MDLAVFCRREWPRLVGALRLTYRDQELAEEVAQESSLDFGHMICRELVEQELTLAPADCTVSDDRRVPPLDQ